MIEEVPSSSTNDIPDEGVLSNTEEEEEEEIIQPSTSKRARRSSQFMEKLKTVFFEKRKSPSTSLQQPKQRRHNKKNRPRPLSYPNLASMPRDEEIPPLPTATRVRTHMTNPFHRLSQTLSRQSTSYLNDIQEVSDHRARPLTIEAMMID